MFDKQKFEIPENVRDLAERNVEQARAAYGQFMQIAQQAQEMMTRSSGTMTASAIEIQMKAMGYARSNLDASFNFAADLARARDLKEYLEIQTRYAQKQMEAYQLQAQELGQMLSAATQKAQPKT